MKREVKFRAWDKITNKMKYPTNHSLNGIRGDLNDDDEFIHMQYTGLKDKNGKEIYEGDLLGFLPKDDWSIKNYVAYEVFYHDNDRAVRHVGFQFNRTHMQGNLAGTNCFPDFLPKNTKKMEVVGNIYENKELLS